MAMNTCHVWKPLQYLLPAGEKIALILLNMPLSSLSTLSFEKLWDNAVYKTVVDGAANELYCRQNEDKKSYIPDVITGDFDSIKENTLKFYKNKGVHVINTPDQNYTDFTKALDFTIRTINDKSIKVDSIVAAYGIGGRLDHTLASIDTLYHASTLTSLPVYIIGEVSVCCLLQEGSSRIDVSTGLEASWCGLVPVGAACQQVTTTGLKWNLNKQCLKFGELISTSNQLNDSGAVTVDTDQPLLWTMGYKESVGPLNSK